MTNIDYAEMANENGLTRYYDRMMTRMAAYRHARIAEKARAREVAKLQAKLLKLGHPVLVRASDGNLYQAYPVSA